MELELDLSPIRIDLNGEVEDMYIKDKKIYTSPIGESLICFLELFSGVLEKNNFFKLINILPFTNEKLTDYTFLNMKKILFDAINKKYGFLSAYLTILELNESYINYINSSEYITKIWSELAKENFNYTFAEKFSVKEFILGFAMYQVVYKAPLFNNILRISSYDISNNPERWGVEARYQVVNINNQLRILYIVKNFIEYLSFSIVQILYKNFKIAQCENCSKFFIPQKSTALYCNNISPQDSTKTCKEYAPQKKYLENLNNSDVKTYYKRCYNRFRNRAIRHKEEAINFNKFLKENAEWENKVNTNIDFQKDYIEWLKTQKN